MSNCRVVVTSIVLLASSAVLAAAPDGPDAAFPRGEVVAEVVAGEDSAQQYALYLPPSYAADRSWPVLVVLDPRGRAVMALELFRAAAAEHGWIVVSSYQSRSDTDAAVTTTALQAILRDVDTRFAVDDRRIYLAGMSGTAFLSWYFAQRLGERVAGVIAVGAGLPRELDGPGPKVPFAYYGIAGDQDFNYRPQTATDAALEEVGATHRLAIFEGVHGWAPEPFTRAAVDWLELMAIKRGSAPRREAFVDARLAAARALAAGPSDPLTTARRYAELVRDFHGLRDIEAEREHSAALERSAELAAARETDRRLARDEEVYAATATRFIGEARQRGQPPTVGRAMNGLELERLQKLANDDDPLVRASARRRLEKAHVQVSFYLPRQFEERGELLWAASMLEIAAAIKPENSYSRWRLAEVYARAGRESKALDALEAAVALTPDVDLERLRDGEAWAPLRKSKRWRALLERLAADATPAASGA